MPTNCGVRARDGRRCQGEFAMYSMLLALAALTSCAEEEKRVDFKELKTIAHETVNDKEYQLRTKPHYETSGKVLAYSFPKIWEGYASDKPNSDPATNILAALVKVEVFRTYP